MNDSSVMEPHVAPLCPSQTVFLKNIYIFQIRGFGAALVIFSNFFPSFFVAISTKIRPKEITDCNC
jgi:hypothetical protein